MKYKWLNKDNKIKLIVFFNGWGMDESVVSRLDAEDYDILMFYDYNTLKTDFDFELIKKYFETNLIAWSMGVMTATLFDIKYNKKVAINGTLKPIDDNFGIPEKIYSMTLNGLTPEGIKKFIANMYLKSDILPKVKRSFEEQKSELAALRNYESNYNFKYDKVFLYFYDKIIPVKNQAAFWKIEPNIKAGHAPFNLFTKWSELL